MKRVPGKSEEVMWLRDLLPSYMKNARIATFSYLSGWYAYKKGVKTSLRELGGRLLNALQLDRQKINVSAHFQPGVCVKALMTKIGSSSTDYLHRS